MTTPRTPGPSRRNGVAELMAGSFKTNGASNPTEVGGEIVSVLRLVDGTAQPFFRVRLDRVLDIDQLDVSVVVGIRSSDPLATPLYYTIGPCTPNPALARRSDEFDLVVLSGGTTTPIDTAGHRIDIQIVATR